MEILKLVQEMQTEEYQYKERRESFKHLCGLDLTEFQLDVLMADTEFNSQTIYAQQLRQRGTSTALLLKIYKSIFIDNHANSIYVISNFEASSRSLSLRMYELLEAAGLTHLVSRHNRNSIEFDHGVSIRFYGSNSQNLVGMRQGCEIFFDDYRLTDSETIRNEALLNVIRPSLPTHMHFFMAGIDELFAHFN